jgi:hypothetical protein
MDQLDTTLRTVLDRHAPVARREVRAGRLEPWYADVKAELKEAKRDRRQAEKKWLRTGLTVFKQIYTAAKKKVTSIIHKAKSAHLSNKVLSCVTTTQLFHVCDTLRGRERNTFLPSIHPLCDLPNVFCDFFHQEGR